MTLTPKKYSEVWQYESLWDAIVVSETAHLSGPSDLPPSLPSWGDARAGTFAEKWAPKLAGKSLTVMYHNDRAGVDGRKHLVETLGHGNTP